jgi:hypothetical protein
MDSASFDEVWKVSKNGYNQAHDAPFKRFREDFLTHRPASFFTPTGIQPSLTATARARSGAPLSQRRSGVRFNSLRAGLRRIGPARVPGVRDRLSEDGQAKRGPR